MATKQAVIDRHIAEGAGIDRNLTKLEVQTKTRRLVDEIFEIVGPDDLIYVASCRKYRIEDEVYAFQTTRGYQKPLLHGKDGTHVTVGMLKNTFMWKFKGLSIETNNPENCNMIEHAIHESLWSYRNTIWLRCGAGAVRNGKNGEVYTFTIAVAFGPGTGLKDRAGHPRLLTDPVYASHDQLYVEQAAGPNASLPVVKPIASRHVASLKASRLCILDEDDVDTKPSKRFRIKDDDDDDDGGGKPQAIKKQVTEPTQAQRQPLGTLELTRPVVKPVAKVTLLGIGGDKIVGPNASRQVVVSRHVASPKASRPSKKRARNTTKTRMMPKSPTFEEDYNDE